MNPTALLLLLLTPCSAAPVSFKSPDGWTIRADYTPPRKGRPVAILAHGVAAGKGEWTPLRKALAARGVGSLAIDLRGHGESLDGPSGKTDFRGFDAARTWPDCRQDIEAAAAYLQKRGVGPKRIGYVGASIGANLASWAQPRPRFLVLLSPGLDYRGVRLSRVPDELPVLVAAGGVAIKVVVDPVRAKRLTDFGVSAIACRTDEQSCQSLIGFGDGGLTGVGFGSGSQKLGHLPEVYSDFLFSVIGEEWGLIGVVLVLICFGLVCWMGFRIAKTARDPFGAYLASGLTLSLGLSAFLHAAVVTRLIPTTGIPLPFMSAGRASLILNLFAAGVLVSIGRARGRPARAR